MVPALLWARRGIHPGSCTRGQGGISGSAHDVIFNGMAKCRYRHRKYCGQSND